MVNSCVLYSCIAYRIGLAMQFSYSIPFKMVADIEMWKYAEIAYR